MAPAQRSGRVRLVEAVKAPIAYFTIALLALEVVLGALAASRALSEQANLVLVSGMVASLLIVLLGFLSTLFLRPHVLFATGPDETAIAEFRRLGEGLTGNDLKVLTRMLGSGAAYFSTFCHGLPQGRDTTPQAKRQSKLEKLRFIEKVESEVQLTMLGTNYVQAIARFSVPSEPMIKEVENPASLIAIAPEFENLGADRGVELLCTISPARIERSLTIDKLNSVLVNNQFDIVHMMAAVDQATGAVKVGPERLSAEGFAALCKQTGAKLVLLATCDSLALAAKVSPHTNVIAASAWVEITAFDKWATTFFAMLAKGETLRHSWEIANNTSTAPMILLLKQDTAFIAAGAGRN